MGLYGGVPLQRIKQWLGHANISQTSTYLEAEASDNDEAMRRDQERLQPIASAVAKAERPERKTGARSALPCRHKADTFGNVAGPPPCGPCRGHLFS